jgi:hypothetical protein
MEEKNRKRFKAMSKNKVGWGVIENPASSVGLKTVPFNTSTWL